VAQILLQNPDIEQVVIHGNADVHEAKSEARRIKLSAERAAVIRRALLERGVAQARLEVVAEGSSKPLSSGGTPADWAKNRRVEFEIVRMKP
jgi:chemotaxis protein MotB